MSRLAHVFHLLPFWYRTQAEKNSFRIVTKTNRVLKVAGTVAYAYVEQFTSPVEDWINSVPVD